MGRIIMDEDTGEIVNKMFPGDRILRAKSIETYQKKEQWKYKPGKDVEIFELEHFFKGHTTEIKKLLCEFSRNERAFLFSVAPYVGYEDCCLKYHSGRDLDMSELAKVADMEPRVLYRTMAELLKKDIIYKGKNSNNIQYFVNPWIFCKGQRINKVLKKMFENYRIRILNGMKWKQIK